MGAHTYTVQVRVEEEAFDRSLKPEKTTQARVGVWAKGVWLVWDG